MKNDKLYPHYLFYLENMLNDGKTTKSKFSLFKISKSYFEDFKNRFENDETFKDMIIELYKSEMRDIKINNILK